tara:strand:- start:80 stop:343 length:264 start_codon:yes stop_codon:yes gene_type:complete
MSKKANQTGRKKGSDKRKNTFKKYGKNTTRGLRIKQADMEKKASKRKEEGDHASISRTNNKGKHCWKRSDNKSLCKITCRNKKKSKK